MIKNILIVIAGMNPTAEIIIQSLKKLEPNVNIKIALANNIPISDLYSGVYQILLIRLCDPALLPLLTLMIKANIPYLYYLDDNLWELKGNTPLARYHSHPKILETLTTFVKHAHCVIAGSVYLREYIYQYNPNVTYISAGFDFDLLNGIAKKPLTNKINVLYSGSLYRDQDFIQITPAIEMIAEEFKHDIVFHFHGFIPQALAKHNNILFDKHFYDYATFIKMQYSHGYDIGIAPLHDSPSSRAKTELKYREYGACGIAGIYSNIPPYTTCVTHQKNGLLVENTSTAWYHALKTLITNTQLRKNIRSTALNDVTNKYNHSVIALDWLTVLNQVPAHHENITQKSIFLLRLLYYKIKIRYQLQRLLNYYQFHGLIFTCKKIARNAFHYE